MLKIVEKTEEISYEHIQNILKEAHKSNEEKGLRYTTQNQSVDKLKLKIGDGICLVAILDDKIAGTATIGYKTLKYWYSNGEKCAIIKCLGVLPQYKGQKIASELFLKCIELAKDNNCNIIITDSAEKNIAFKKYVINLIF